MWATPMNSSCQTVYSPVDSPLMFFVGLDEVRTNKTNIWKNQTQSNQPFTSSSYWSHTAVGWYPQPVSQLCHTLNLWFNYHWQNLDSYCANLYCKSVKDSIAVLCAEEARKLCSCVVVFLGWVSPNTSLKLPYGTGPFRISQTCYAWSRHWLLAVAASMLTGAANQAPIRHTIVSCWDTRSPKQETTSE